jgi:hypothetical protein
MSAITVHDLIQLLWVAPDDAEWTPKVDSVPLDDVRRWMVSEDLEVLGFAEATINDRRFRIEPPLSQDEYLNFRKRYLARCFIENPDGEWSDSRYSAGWDLVRLILHLWDADSSQPALVDFKNWLARLYKQGDKTLQTCIVHATLEHVFERKPLRNFFSDWKRDPELAKAYEEACLWDLKTPLSD